ncbi:hypothetical protein TSOC_003880 [Tetrabaena socialis]|uniref:Uncharacterized protein n=1 Tax=Tetrabaena socialis TaxID=47790 RepID=A0A2J8AAE3_9CHLO|nr:hypothetical protein TSOC_003880 [Tetrabaena socialis]|eukprot:PNH09487.1 hypothetical protein TSOC_003880 [Tetrabaena socialis]
MLLELQTDGGLGGQQSDTSTLAPVTATVHLDRVAITNNTVIWGLDSMAGSYPKTLWLDDISVGYGAVVFAAQGGRTTMVDLSLSNTVINGNQGGYGAAIAIVGGTNMQHK